MKIDDGIVLSSSFLPKFQPSIGVSVVAAPPLKPRRPNLIVNSSRLHIFQPLKNLIAPTKQPLQLHEIIFKPLDDFIHRLFINASSIPSFIDPKHTLSGNFLPVAELPPTACDVVEGSLPSCLDGAYIQNGPNPQFIPRGPYHYTDGDGMLHSVKISGGKATFCSRFVKTHKYTVERDLGYPIFPNFVASLNQTSLTASTWLTVLRMISFQFSPLVSGIGTANTSLFLFAGNLFALLEYDLPYQIKMTEDGDLITVGRHGFHSSSELFINMTAHPKTDTETGEAFAFSFNVVPPFLTLFRIGSDGRKQNNVPIFSTKGAPSFVHDFAVTKRFAIFPETQVLIDPLGAFGGKRMMRVDPDKVARLGIISRYAVDESEMYWIDVPGLNMLHTVNAWEEDHDGGETIVIVASNVLSLENVLEGRDSRHVSLEKIRIDVRRKVVVRRPVSDRNLDFGAVNPRYAGKKNRYMYAAVTDGGYPKMRGVVKLDLSLLDDDDGGDCTVGSHMYGEGCYGSEPVFVAREADNAKVEEEEDDGYLLSYVHNENTKESELLVMDAKSPSLESVAVVKLPQRVPHGFHAIFVKQSELPIISPNKAS